MTIKDEILIAANQLANQGQKPTVALIKTKLSQSIPLPQIIGVLKSWQHQPDFTALEKDAKTVVKQGHDKTPSEQEVQQQIEQAILPLKAEINELKALIQQLLDKNS
ncbi:hypothetical protein [Thalassotalea sp. G2M2-11]|uniref:hypothetical protein n=1 Tax=Thalassotalea sp. G2M2-11 TaxID=2787627 RepID=UPI0019D2B855|nr:hypothetical protein [Thalassotalea sp. G2M2-11]